MVLVALLAVADLAAYQTWTCVTPRAVDMTPSIAMSCVGPRSWDVSPQNPHVKKRFKVWVNPTGRATMMKPLVRKVREGLYTDVVSVFPAGSVLVKEKFDAAMSFKEVSIVGQKAKPLPARPELLTIMVKGEKGSKPATGDWTYLVADAALKRQDSSQESRCASCHASQKNRDFTFRRYGIPELSVRLRLPQ